MNKTYLTHSEHIRLSYRLPILCIVRTRWQPYMRMNRNTQQKLWKITQTQHFLFYLQNVSFVIVIYLSVSLSHAVCFHREIREMHKDCLRCIAIIRHCIHI